jgi:hypothetical protein
MTTKEFITETIKNQNELRAVCKEFNLLRQPIGKTRYVVLTADKQHVGVIECEPSNNGKYYGYRSETRCECFKAAPIFRSFRQMVEFVVIDNLR